MNRNLSFIADIGGTNARFALADPSLDMPKANGRSDAEALPYTYEQQVKCADFNSIAEAIHNYLNCYLKETEAHMVQSGCLAIAAPVDDSKPIRFTNNNWSFETKELKKQLGFQELAVINDFTAVAHAVLKLTPKDCLNLTTKPIDIRPPEYRQTFAVVGPGTGLGVGGLTTCGKRFHVLTSEGGHAGFAPDNELETEVFRLLKRQFQRLSYERLLSGSGLVNLYNTLAEIEGVEPQNLEPAAIGKYADEGTDPLCERTLHLFCDVLGCFAGDVALTFDARDGIYIGGGILPRYQNFLKKSNFMQRFVNKGRYQSMMEEIPVQLITHPSPGLLGSATKALMS